LRQSEKFSFQHPAGGPAGVRRSLPAVFHSEVIIRFDGGLGEEEGVVKVTSVYKKLERLKRLAGFLG
jgi:hypothetical protein